MNKESVRPQSRLRLSRVENRANTRARLIAVGREHFLTKGFAGTILEQVAEDAGFSRGALYSNFRGKEDLFLEVFDTDLHMRVSQYHEILDRDAEPGSRLGELRTAFVDHVTDRSWGILRTEFELSALHSEKLRRRFAQVHRRDLANAIDLANKAVEKGELVLKIPVSELILVTQSFMMGLALKQQLIGRGLTNGKLRAIAEAFFDCFIAGPVNKTAKRRKANDLR